ncbi:MAG: sulfite oxidase-like oxidoreductase, partial [Planctomycetota bacterium]
CVTPVYNAPVVKGRVHTIKRTTREGSMTDASDDLIVSKDVLRDIRLPPGQVLTAVERKTGKRKFPVLDAVGPPQIDLTRWTLRIFGLVEEELALDWEAFSALPRAKLKCDIHCVTRWSRLDNLFEGPHVRTVMERVKIEPDATHVLLHSHDRIDGHGNWTTNLPLGAFLDEDCLFATHHDGQPLSLEHGGPCRLVVPRLYFWKSAKWVKGVELMAGDRPGFWEQNGYHMHGDPWAEQRFGGG